MTASASKLLNLSNPLIPTHSKGEQGLDIRDLVPWVVVLLEQSESLSGAS